MTWKERVFILVAALVALGTVGLIIAAMPKPVSKVPTTLAAPVSQQEPLVTYLDPAYGKADATKTIVLYANYACPFCKALESDLKNLIANHQEVRLVWKDLPNEQPGSEAAAEAAQCAKVQGKFWEYHDLLLNDGGDWGGANLAFHANSLGLNLDSFTSCLQNHDMKPLIDHTISEGIALGIDATPTMYVGKTRYVGQLPYAQLEAAIR